MSEDKKKPNGCAIGCLTVIGIILILLLIGSLFSCQGNSQEKEWVNQLRQEKAEAEELYRSNITPEEKATQAREKAQTLQAQYDQICEETDKSQLDYPLLRGYVCVREMYTSLAYMAENVDYNESSNTYFQSNGEAENILRDYE